MLEKIVIRGARENNLKNIDLEIPRDKLVVVTGVSGSGKSTLAFDTIYAEGERRYMQSLSAYARQFMGGMKKPDVDYIEGLSPSISIDQKTTSHNPRSTVGTVTEIYDYLRLLYGRIGRAYCPIHGCEIKGVTVNQICDYVMRLEEGTRITIMSPLVKEEKGTHKDLIEKLINEGFNRVRVDDEIYLLEETPQLEKNKKHSIDIVVDRIVKKDDSKERIIDSLETALKWSDGLVVISHDGEDDVYSTKHSCPKCGFSIPKLEPRLFSYNTPLGACDECHGLGVKEQCDIDRLIQDPNKSIRNGGINYYKNIVDTENIEWQEFEYLCKLYNIDLDKPLKEFNEEEMDIVLNGSREVLKYSITTRSGNVMHRNGFIEGVKRKIERLYVETTSQMMRDIYGYYMREIECPKCHGNRLNEAALSVKLGKYNIMELCSLSVEKIHKYISELKLTEQEASIGNLAIKEIKHRLEFLINVGLGYLSLKRVASSLSGGELQRIRLATQIGSKLSGVLYVLDEPSIGLHQKDNAMLIKALKEMRDLGNTLIVVEHDEETMLESDYLIDIGPRAGVHGGEVVACGTPSEVIKNDKSLTGQYLSGKLSIDVPKERRAGNGKFIEIKGAKENNLKNIDVKIPLGCLVVVTGVSGSGKSTLINQTLYNSAYKHINPNSRVKSARCEEVLGLENIDKVINVSQEPIGRTPRSNPATYVGVFDDIRDLFMQTPLAKERGYLKGRFSFNVPGGRCEKCQGDGVIRVPMHFLPDVYVECEECHGKRYNEQTLEVKYKEKNIFDILDMTIEDAYLFFENIPSIKRKLKALMDVGLGYVKVGQSALTLSGGEAQRVKLANELQRRSTGQTLYVLDEPTTGLHIDDVKRLMAVISRIVDNGDSVVIIEHNLDVIKLADYIIDLGPDGGDNGGMIVAKGTPEAVSKIKKSYTGEYLAKILDKKDK
jgi:excinuclease ABC subunit A